MNQRFVSDCGALYGQGKKHSNLWWKALADCLVAEGLLKFGVRKLSSGCAYRALDIVRLLPLILLSISLQLPVRGLTCIQTPAGRLALEKSAKIPIIPSKDFQRLMVRQV